MRRGTIALAAVTLVIVFAAVVLRPKPTALPAPPTEKIRAALRAEVLEPRFEALKPLHAPGAPIAAGDWLAEQPEQGETFAAYVDGGPVRASPERRTIYLQPIGRFTDAQQRVLAQTQDYVAAFFQLPVVTLPTLPESQIPPDARRGNQILTTFVIEKVLAPARPNDALAVLALTATDLFPAADWNFVFGEASPADRVGVWSLARNGTPGTPRYLMRTVKTAAHELGHMLSLQHCVGWSCVMAGSNSLEESDRGPASMCPVCLQKLTWNTGLDPAARFDALAAFYADAGIADEQAMAIKERAAMTSGASSP